MKYTLSISFNVRAELCGSINGIYNKILLFQERNSSLETVLPTSFNYIDSRLFLTFSNV